MDYARYYRGSTSGVSARDDKARHRRSYSRDSRSNSRDRERSRQKRRDSYGSRSPSYSYRHRDIRSPESSRRAQMLPEWKTEKRGSEGEAASFDFASSLFQDLLKATGAAPQPPSSASPHLAGRSRGRCEHSRSSRDRSSSEDRRSWEQKDHRRGRKRSSEHSGNQYGSGLKRSRTGDSRGRRRDHRRSYSRSRSGSSSSSSSVSYRKRRRRSRSSSLSSVSSSSFSNSPRTRGLRELDREYNRRNEERKEQKSERSHAQGFSPTYSVVSSTDGIESSRHLTEEQFREEMYRRLRSELSSSKDPARREERIAQHIREMAKLSPTLFREFMVNNAENLSAMSFLSSESPEPHREQQKDEVDSPRDSPPYVKQRTVQNTQDSSEPAVERKSPESKSSLEDVMQKLNQYKNKLKERNELTFDLLPSGDVQPLTVDSAAAVEQQALHGEGQSKTVLPSAFASFEEKEKQYEAWRASLIQASPASSSMTHRPGGMNQSTSGSGTSAPENVQGISVHVGKTPEDLQRFAAFPHQLIPVKGQDSQQDAAQSGSSIRPSSLMSGRWKAVNQGSASVQQPTSGKASASFSADKRKHHSPSPQENKKSSAASSLLDLMTRKPVGEKHREKGKPSLHETKAASQGKADKLGYRSNKTSSELSGKRSESSSRSSSKRPESSKNGDKKTELNESSSQRKSEPDTSSDKNVESGQLAKELLDKHHRIALVQKDLNALKKIQYDWLVALGNSSEKDPVITENDESQEELKSRIATVLKGGQALPNFPGSYLRSKYRSAQTGKGDEKFHVGMSLKEFIKQFSSTEKGKVAEKDVTVAGKIQVKQISRDKPNLFELCEEGVKIQVISKHTFCKSIEDFKVMEDKLKKGDLVGVRGRPGMSKTGLLSIVPCEVTELISVQSSNSTHTHYAVKEKQAGRKSKAAAVDDDRAGHCCIPCQVGFHALRDFLTHLQSEDHQTKTRLGKDCLRPWQKQDLKKYLKETPQTKAKGEEFLVATGAFYCFLCSELCSDSKVVDAHLTSQDHHSRYQDYLSWNPKYEKRYKEERAKLLSTAIKAPQAGSEDRTERDRDQETRSKDGDRKSADRDRRPARDHSRRSSDRDRKSRSRDRGSRSKSRERRRSRSRERRRSRSIERSRRSRSRDRSRRSRSRDRRRRSRSRERSRRSRSRDRSRRSRSRNRSRRSRSRDRSKKSRERDKKSKSRERDQRTRDGGMKSKDQDERPADRKSRDGDTGTDDQQQSEKSQAREGIEIEDKQAASGREKGKGEKSDTKERTNDGDEDVLEMDLDENIHNEETSTKDKPHAANEGFLKILSWREEIERQMALMFNDAGEGDESKRDSLETEDVSEDPSEKQTPELDDDITAEDETGKTAPKEKHENTLDGETGESELTTEQMTTEDQEEPPEGSGDGVQKPSIPKATQEQLLSVELVSEPWDAVKTDTETSGAAPAGMSEASSVTMSVPPPAVTPVLSDAELMPPPMSIPSPGFVPPVSEVTPHSLAPGLASAEVDSSHAQPPPVPKGSQPPISPEQSHLQSAVAEGHAEPAPSQSSVEPVSAGLTAEEAVHLEPSVEQPASPYYGDENISSPEYEDEDITSAKTDTEDSVPTEECTPPAMSIEEPLPPAVDVEYSLSFADEESASLGVDVENLASESLAAAAAGLPDGGAESSQDMCESGTTPPATSTEAAFTSLPDVAVGSSELEVSSMKAAAAMEEEVETLQEEGEQSKPVTACLEKGRSKHSDFSLDEEEDKIVLSFDEGSEPECQDNLHKQEGTSCRHEPEVASPMTFGSSEADPLVTLESSISDAKDRQNEPVEQTQVSAMDASDQSESQNKESTDPVDVSGDNMTVPVEEDKDGAVVLQEGDHSLELDMPIASTSSPSPPPLAQALSPQARDSNMSPSEECAQMSDDTAAVMAEGEAESEVLAQIDSLLHTAKASPGAGAHQQTASLSLSDSALFNTDSSVSDSPASSPLRKRSPTARRGRGKKRGQSRAAAACPADEDSVVAEEEEEELIVVTEQATLKTSTRQTRSHTVQPQQSVENQEGEKDKGSELCVELCGSSEQLCDNSTSGAMVVDPDTEKMEAENVMSETAAETESVPHEEETQTLTDDVSSETPSSRRRPTRQSKKAAAAAAKLPSARGTRTCRGRGRGRVSTRSTRRSGNLLGKGGDGSALLHEETSGLSASSQGEEEGEVDVV